MQEGAVKDREPTGAAACSDTVYDCGLVRDGGGRRVGDIGESHFVWCARVEVASWGE